MIGLCGAQRTGKSTLVTAYSQETGTPALYTGVSGVFADMGLDPKADYPLTQRLEIQRRVLDRLEKQYRSVCSEPFIADRTPIDLIAYTLADVQRQNVPSELESVIEKYMDDCFFVTNQYFAVLIGLQPGIAVVEEEGKAPGTFSYSEHINAIVMGLVVSEKIKAEHFLIPRRMTELEERVEALNVALDRARSRHEAMKQRRIEAGRAIVLH